MRRLVAGLLVMATAAAGRAAASTNHVRNAHFGTGVDYWTPSIPQGMSFGWTSGKGHAALGAVEFGTDATQRNLVVLTQCVGVKEGVSYTFGFAFQYASGYGTAAKGLLTVQWYTSANCGLGFLAQTDSTAYSSTGGAFADTWQTLSSSAVAPAGAVSARLEVAFVTDAAATARAYYDDIHLNGGLSGDANASGARDVNDVFYLINFLFAGGPLPTGPADVNSSDDIDVADVFYLINFLFAGGAPPL